MSPSLNLDSISSSSSSPFVGSSSPASVVHVTKESQHHYENNSVTIPNIFSSSASNINYPPKENIIHRHTIGSVGSNTNSNSSSNGGQPNWFDLPKMDNFVDFFSVCCSTAVIFGGLVPYIPQYNKIKKSMNSDGFSTYVCLTLLLANIMRIMFWFGHHFETPLLIQSFVMIIGMLAMMEICVRVRDKVTSFTISSISGGPTSARRRFLIGDEEANLSERLGESMPIYSVPSTSFSTSSQSATQGSRCISAAQDNFSINSYQNEPLSNYVSYTASLGSSGLSSPARSEFRNQSGGLLSDDSLGETITIRTIQPHDSSGNQPKWFSLHNFWNWDHILSYIKFLTIFTLILSVLTYLLIDNYLFVESLGFVSVLTESMLGMPQLFKNYAKKSTRGMSVEMVIMWLSGDLFKTLYYIIKKTPVQFYICGSIQVIVDILILSQVFWYRRPNVTYRKLPKNG